MSLRGVRQLKQLTIRYSDYDGSSRGIREYMSKNLLTLAEKNPAITIKTELKRCAHPLLRGEYVNGNNKVICIKNLDEQQIHNYVLMLRNQIGRKMNSTGYKKPIVSSKPSIQGEWHERMDLIGLNLDITKK